MIPILFISFSELYDRCLATLLNSEDHVVNTQCREGATTSAAVYTPLEGGIRSAPVPEAMAT